MAFTLRQIFPPLLIGMHLLAAAPALFAQASFTGTLLGTVTDSSGAVLPGAEVAAINLATNERQTTQTDSAGNFLVPTLKPGTYRLEVGMDGFKRLLRDGITLQIDQQARVDVQLEIGGVAESVAVRADAPLLQTQSAALGQVIDNRTIVTLPLSGRGAFALVGLAPGVTDGSQGAREASARIQGGRNRLNEIQLDGITAVNVGNGSVGYTPMVDALQEFKILTNSFAAEFGRTGGGVIIAAIKSGSNKFTGTTFEFWRNDALNARNYFAKPDAPKPKLRYNQVGFALGGPVRKDRTFFFVDWQGTRDRTASTRVSSVPTPAMRRGDFSSGFNAIVDPTTGQVFPGNVIPPGRFDPAAARILEYYPLPNAPGLANNYVLSTPGTRRADQGDIRIDHNLAPNDRLVARYSINDIWNVPSPRFQTAGNPENYPFKGRQQNGVISYTKSITSKVLNEARFGFNRIHNNNISPTLGQNFPSQLGVPNVPPDVFPLINISGLTSLGNQRSRPTLSTSTSFQIVDNVTIVRGRHYIKTGLDIRRSEYSPYSPTNASGEFSFSALQTGRVGQGRTGEAFASFLLGVGNGLQFLPGLNSHLQVSSYDVYAQDDFQRSPNLTLSFGVRYEPGFHFTEREDRISSFDPERRTLRLAGVDGAPRHFYEDDYNNFGPRAGLAYSIPAWKAVVRLGYGMFFATPAVASNPGTPLEAAFPWARSFTVPSVPLGQPLFVLSGFPGGESTFDTTGRTAGEIVYFDPNSPTPRMESWNVTVQREMTKHLSIELSYAGTKGSNLYTPGANLNQIPTELLGPPEMFGGLTAQQRRPFPEFNNIALNEFSSSSIYQSGQLKVQQRLSDGLSFLLAYTYSKSIDDGSGLFPGDNPNTGGSGAFRRQNRYDLEGERAISADDQTHRLTISYAYDLPWGPGRRWVNRDGLASQIFGGWQVAGVTLMRSGLPFGIHTATNTTDSLGGRQRANRVGDGALPQSERSIQRWFDTSAFEAPPPYTFGNSPRNVLRGPGVVNFDLLLGKRLRAGRGFSAELRGEFFNLFNEPHFGLPGAALGTPQFGVIDSADDGRTIQLGVKVYFGG